MLLYYKKYSTVLLFLVYKLGSCYYSFSGTFLPKYAVYIAVVHPSLSYSDGVHNHYDGIFILLHANLIDTVVPF